MCSAWMAEDIFESRMEQDKSCWREQMAEQEIIIDSSLSEIEEW